VPAACTRYLGAPYWNPVPSAGSLCLGSDPPTGLAEMAKQRLKAWFTNTRLFAEAIGRRREAIWRAALLVGGGGRQVVKRRGTIEASVRQHQRSRRTAHVQ